MTDLADQQCQPYAKGSTALEIKEITKHKEEINPDWSLSGDNKQISREFKFKNYYETMAFVNVVAMVAHQQDHHPDMSVSYNKCTVTFSTHSVGGLSKNDFICAAKIDNTLEL